MGRIRAVLWDADGVLQDVPHGWEASMRPVVQGHIEDVPAFLTEAFAAERPALTGEVRWRDVLPGLLERWQVSHLYDDALRVWLTIEPHAEVRELVQVVRRSGVGCYLATNQDEYRGRHMHEALGYGELLDGAFYSYELGVAKPDPAFFSVILERLSLPVGDVLFVDDNQANVESARALGMRAEHWHVGHGVPSLRELLQAHELEV